MPALVWRTQKVTQVRRHKTARASGNLPGGQTLRECSRQKEQLPAIHLSQHTGPEHVLDARDQTERQGDSDEQSTHSAVLTGNHTYRVS